MKSPRGAASTVIEWTDQMRCQLDVADDDDVGIPASRDDTGRSKKRRQRELRLRSVSMSQRATPLSAKEHKIFHHGSMSLR